MNRLCRRSVLCLAAIAGTILVAAAPPRGPRADAPERLVEQLGSDEFAERESASERLLAIGEPALDALYKALASDDLEVRRRARRIVTILENKLYGPELLLRGHTGFVWSVSVSADGKRLLTGGEDWTVRLWDAYTGKELRVFKGHTERVNGAVLSADGQRVLSASTDGTVRLWDAATGKQIHKLTGHDRAECVAFGPKGKAISGGWDNKVNLWDLNTGRKLEVFTGHTVYVYGAAYSDKAGLAATSSGDCEVRLWDLDRGVEVRKFSGGSRACFSADGKRLLATGYGPYLRLLDVGSGKELKRIRAHEPYAFAAAFSPDGKRIVSGGEDATVRVWDVATGKELRKYQGHTRYVVGVAFFPNGKRIASTSWDGTTRVWRAPR